MGRLIRMDWAIKKILRDKANFEILEGFLSELLRFDISIVEILESESNKQHEHDKFNRVDLLVKNEAGELILVEVQNGSEMDYLQRLLFGTSKALVEHLNEGQPYSEIRKVYSVSIIYFDLGRGEDYLYHGKTRFRGLRKGDALALTEEQRELFKAETPAALFPEYYLIKVPKYDDEIRDTLDEWIFFLKHEEIKDDFRAKGLKAAREKLVVMKMSDEEQRQYRAYLEDLHFQASMVESHYGRGLRHGHKAGHKEGHKEGHKAGHKAGHKEGRKEVARNLIARGYEAEVIAESTGMSLDEIQKL